MAECQDYRTIIQNYAAGEISHVELESLHRHCQTCRGCRQLVDVHIGMTRAGREIPEPDEAHFYAMRENVMAQIAHDRHSAPWRSSGLRLRWWDLRGLLRVYPAAGVVMSLAVIACAVLVGRWSAGAPRFDDGILINEMNRQATQAAGLDDYWDTPFTYANVSARPVAGGKLDMSFDVCRHISVVTNMNSPLAREVLINAILSPSAMGSQMKAMELTQQIGDPRLEQVLVFTMHNDPSLAVRLQALSVISEYPYDTSVRDAMLATLSRDDAVQMRILALEYLTEKQVGMETLRETIGRNDLESNKAVLQHAIELANRQARKFN